MKNFIYTLLVAAVTTACSGSYVPVETFTEPEDPVALTAEQQAAWEGVNTKLNAAWGCPDRQYARSVVPEKISDGPFHITVWKGERASAQIVLWSAGAIDGVKCKVGDFKSKAGTMPASVAEARFVRYTLADEQNYNFKKGGPEVIAPDMLDSLKCFDMATRTTRPVWISLDIPRDVAAGTYTTEVVVSHNGFGKVKLPLEVEVLNQTLKPVTDWTFHLDLWQHPSSVAYAHGVELWSDAHFEAMKPVMERLRDAGQKVITATLNKDPWNHQCYYAYEPMIKWTKHKDGSWSYDYAVFDRWVQFMLNIGINKYINCYSMVPWNCELEYFDETEGKIITVKAEPNTPIFPVIWKPFLKDFKKHLEEKGWLKITNIAMDERSPEAMQAAAEVLMDCAPEMGFALADNHRSYEKFTMMRDVCAAMRHQTVTPEDIAMRRAQGYTTTFYVCCTPSFPNTFTTSQPYEAELLGWKNIAHDYDGFLRWAYNSWAENPQYDSRYGKWMSGDTYLVYPYNRSSIRFERLIDGFEVTEKIRALRAAGVDMSGVDAVLEKIRNTKIVDYKQPWLDIVNEARKALDDAARK